MEVDAFIQRWTAREGGAERANYQMFLAELCDVIDVPRPDPAGAETQLNDYAFERSVKRHVHESMTSPLCTDRDVCGGFVVEAKPRPTRSRYEVEALSLHEAVGERPSRGTY